MSMRMEELEKQIADLQDVASAKEDKANLESELRNLTMIALEQPISLRRRVEILKKH
jgi:hypothetical protein